MMRLCARVTRLCPQADFRVECGTPAHAVHSVIAVVVLLGFCCGLPVFTGMTLSRRFRDGRLHDARTERRYLFLFDGYKDRRAW